MRMPDVPFLNITGSGARMTRWDVVCVHTIVGYQAGGNAAHFTTNWDGHIIQARDTAYQSAANYLGNYRVIAIENEDHGKAYGPWDTRDGHAVPAFTNAQCEAISEIVEWACWEHKIPLVLCPDSRSSSRGVAYHRQGIDGNFGSYDFGGRVSGGELWSTHTGKVCPGDRRIHQLIDVIIPRALEIRAVRTGAAPKPDPIQFMEGEMIVAVSDFDTKPTRSGVLLPDGRMLDITSDQKARDKMQKNIDQGKVTEMVLSPANWDLMAATSIVKK